MEDPEGLDGELVDRFLAAVDDRDWYDLGWFIVYAVGGAELDSVVPDTGEKPKPGTIGAKMHSTHRVVGHDEYFARMRQRLTALVRSGLREDLLVRALRDEVTTHFQRFAQTEAANTRRKELADDLERTAADKE